MATRHEPGMVGSAIREIAYGNFASQPRQAKREHMTQITNIAPKVGESVATVVTAFVVSCQW
jgi:hypothetical protein